mgnify:CR=1 FL=1
MDAYERIPADDWPAFQSWAWYQDDDVEDLAEAFEREYRGEYRSLAEFALTHAVWEHNLPDILIPFLSVQRYVDWIFGDDGCFVSIGHRDGVWIFQIAEEPRMLGPFISIDEAAS